MVGGGRDRKRIPIQQVLNRQWRSATALLPTGVKWCQQPSSIGSFRLSMSVSGFADTGAVGRVSQAQTLARVRRFVHGGGVGRANTDRPRAAAEFQARVWQPAL
jgi:hypothetical protein